MKVKIGKYPKSTKNRKVDVQINPTDTWNLDHTLAHIIYPALLQLREVKHGIPSEFGDVGGGNDTMQDSFDFYKETYAESFEESCKLWDETLDKIIWSFEQIIKADYGDKYHHGESDWDFVESEELYPNPISGVMEKTFQMVDKNPEGHWFDMEGHQLHEDRIQEGLDLFGKYYRSLWD